jgi:predicted DNA-binding ribbon-helix-helix protein
MGEAMAPPEQRSQRSVTLSERAAEDYQIVADYLGMPVASLLRQVLEQHHQSSEFASLLRRALARGAQNH